MAKATTKQERYHNKLKEQGFVRRAYYATPEDHAKLLAYANELKQERLKDD